MNEHYKKNKIEAIEVIQSWGLNFTLGNVVKYIARAKFKDDYVKDIQKAIDYLNYELNSPKLEGSISNYINVIDVIEDWELNLEETIALLRLHEAIDARRDSSNPNKRKMYETELTKGKIALENLL